jgi:hypothetical protein
MVFPHFHQKKSCLYLLLHKKLTLNYTADVKIKQNSFYLKNIP